MKLVASLIYSALSTFVGIWLISFAVILMATDNMDMVELSAVFTTGIVVVLLAILYWLGSDDPHAYILWRGMSALFCNLGSMFIWLCLSLSVVFIALGAIWHMVLSEPSIPQIVTDLSAFVTIVLAIILSIIFGDPAINKTHNFIEQRMSKQ